MGRAVYEVYPDELERLIYKGTEDITDELKKRYYRLIIAFKKYKIFPETGNINLDMLINALDKYYTKYEREYERGGRIVRHKQLFQIYGLPTKEEREKGILPKLIEDYSEIRNYY